jgi:hypothetical protein
MGQQSIYNGGHPSCVSRFRGSHPGLVWVSHRVSAKPRVGPFPFTRYSEQAFLVSVKHSEDGDSMKSFEALPLDPMCAPTLF